MNFAAQLAGLSIRSGYWMLLLWWRRASASWVMPSRWVALCLTMRGLFEQVHHPRRQRSAKPVWPTIVGYWMNSKAKPNAPIAAQPSLFLFYFWIWTASRKSMTTYGHLVGQPRSLPRCRHSAHSLPGRLIPAARYGGDEFCSRVARVGRKLKRKAWLAASATSWKWIRRSRHFPQASESVFIAATESVLRNCSPDADAQLYQEKGETWDGAPLGFSRRRNPRSGTA